jgi:hypothetical protein
MDSKKKVNSNKAEKKSELKKSRIEQKMLS